MNAAARPIVVSLFFAAALPQVARGQAAWEYTPYQARLWIAGAGAPQLTPAVVEQLTASVTSRGASVLGPVLNLQPSSPPPRVLSALRQGMDELTADSVAALLSKEDLEADKIYLALISDHGGAHVASVRELDCRTRQLGPVIQRKAPTARGLALALWDAVRESFTPLARIEQAADGQITARLRAGGLAADGSPALVEPGMVLRPVLRRNDRTGQPTKGGILAVGWTYFSVTERHGPVLEGTQRSGYRLAIPARGGSRLERLALLVRPYHDQTRLLLRSRVEPEKPLVGYEIHRRVENTEKTELVGVTDHEGALVLSASGGQLETFIVKSGRQLLARLPIVPGYESELKAHITDDDGRLAAEGVIAALSSRALDLVARREILAARIRARLKDNKPKEAQQLLDEFRRLASRGDLSRELDRFRQQITSRDRTTQARIDSIFADGQRLLLLKPLSDELMTQLTREVNAAATSAQARSASEG
jgi:hypothetical protein